MKRFANAIKIKAIIKINNSDKVENKTYNKNKNNNNTNRWIGGVYLRINVCAHAFEIGEKNTKKNKTKVYLFGNLDAIAFNIPS